MLIKLRKLLVRMLSGFCLLLLLFISFDYFFCYILLLLFFYLLFWLAMVAGWKGGQKLGERVPCPNCQRTYKNKKHLYRHLRSGCGEEAERSNNCQLPVFRCIVCPYRTYIRGFLNRHTQSMHGRSINEKEWLATLTIYYCHYCYYCYYFLFKKRRKNIHIELDPYWKILLQFLLHQREYTMPCHFHLWGSRTFFVWWIRYIGGSRSRIVDLSEDVNA